MQKVLIITASLFLLSFSANAHGEEGHKKDNESQEQIQNDSMGEASSIQVHIEDAGHVHGEPDTHHADAIVKEKASFESFPTLHPMVVHFPIVLLLFAALFQIISFFVFKEQLSWVTLGLATAGLLGAYVAGRYVHPHTNGLSETAAWVLDKHEWFADYTLWSAFFAVVLKSISHFFETKIMA